MKTRLTIIALVVCLVVLGSGWVLTFSSLQDTRFDLEESRTEITRLEGVNEKYLKDLGDKVREVRALEWDLGEVRQEVAVLQQDVEAARQEIAALQDSLDLYRDTFGEVYSGLQPPYGTHETQLSLDMRNFNLLNNKDSVNPSWEELKGFLRLDKTDQHDYLEYGKEYKVKEGYLIGVYMCGNFAEALHNNAEEAGIRSAWVVLDFEEGIPHALNAFKTTDKGLIFIDCTGLEPGTRGPRYLDKIWTVKLNQKPVIRSVFPDPGWETLWRLSGGKVIRVEIYW